MVIRVLISFIFCLCFAPKALACSCGWGETRVSEFVKTVTVLHGTIYKTRWIGGTEVPMPPYDPMAHKGSVPFSPAVDIIRWQDDYFKVQTDIKSVLILGGERQETYAITHNMYGSACGMSAVLAKSDWYVLRDEPSRPYNFDICLNNSVPIGAILDYHLNGTDALVPSRRTCWRHDRAVKKAKNTSAPVPEDKDNCAFWGRENQKRLSDIVREYEMENVRHRAQ